jgi:two-component system, OmpR family, response regulator
MPSILLVDDDRAFSPLVKEYLEAKGMQVSLKHNAEEGLKAFREGAFDICALDVKMPMKDGFALAREIRAFDDRIPLLFLTGQTEKEDRIKGLSLGADDYVTKPFSMEELFLRIQAILRRAGAAASRQRETVYSLGSYRFNPASRDLSGLEETVKLTGIEARLLLLFLESESGLVKREEALKKIWSDEDLLRGRSLNVYVSKLRQYLKDDPGIEILNVHGEGYRLILP